MKKTLLIATILIASATTLSAQAKNKKKDKKAPQPVSVEKAALRTQADSIAYAAGMTITKGLDRYLTEVLGVAPEQMPEFMRGLKAGIAQRRDTAFTAYTAGLEIARQVEKTMLPSILSQFEGIEKIDPDMIYQGFMASLQKDTAMLKQEQAEQYYQTKLTALKHKKDMANKQAGEEFLAQNKQRPGVNTLPNGLQYRIITQGTGPQPTIDDRVNVVYEGKTIDGKIFDATSRHGSATHDTFGVKGLIQGWREALMLMPAGSKWEIFIPQELAYGERGAGKDIAPYSALIFTLELQSIAEPITAVRQKQASDEIQQKTTPKAEPQKATKKPARRRK